MKVGRTSSRTDALVLPCVTEALREAKEREEEELRKRREAEENEVAKRLKETREKERIAAAKMLQKKESEAKPLLEQKGSLMKEGEAPQADEKERIIEELKKAYRRLRKQPKTDEILTEMKKIKKRIAELTGHKKKKEQQPKVMHLLTKPNFKQKYRKYSPKKYEGLEPTYSFVCSHIWGFCMQHRRQALTPSPEVDPTLWRTDEQIEDEKRKERVREMLKSRQTGAAAMLAKIMKEGDVEPLLEEEDQEPPEEGEEEDVEEEESEEESDKEDEEVATEEESDTFSMEGTISSGSVSSYESTEYPVFQRSQYHAPEYKATPENLEEWMKHPVDYCGRMLLETKESAEQQRTRAVATARIKAPTQQSEQARMLLMLEARGPVILVYSSAEPPAPKKRFSLAALCRKEKPDEKPEIAPLRWKYLCAFMLDNTGEAQEVKMGSGNPGQVYKAIKVNGRIIPDPANSAPEDGPPHFTKTELALREKTYFSGFLSADTDAETEEWLVVFNGRKTFFRYLSVCGDANQKPTLPLVASLWSPGPREIVLEGTPYHNAIDKALFSSLKVPYLDAVYCGWRDMNGDDLAATLQNISCKVRTLDLTANNFSSAILKQIGDVCVKLKISYLSVSENNISGDMLGVRGIAELIKNPQPLLLEMRRIAMTDEDCAHIAAELENIKQPCSLPKTINMGENDISVGGLKVLAASVARALPRLRALCVPNVPSLGPNEVAEALKAVPDMRPAQLSTNDLLFPFRSLNERELPEKCLSLPATFSGRLFMENDSVATGANDPEPVSQLCLAFFELRGPALFCYRAPTRSNSPSPMAGRKSPNSALSPFFGDGLEGIFVSSATISGLKLTATGKKIVSADLVSKEKSETWVLEGESEDYVREWFRVLTLRCAGVSTKSVFFYTRCLFCPLLVSCICL